MQEFVDQSESSRHVASTRRHRSVAAARLLLSRAANLSYGPAAPMFHLVNKTVLGMTPLVLDGFEAWELIGYYTLTGVAEAHRRKVKKKTHKAE